MSLDDKIRAYGETWGTLLTMVVRGDDRLSMNTSWEWPKQSPADLIVNEARLEPLSYSIEELEALGTTGPQQETPDAKAAREELLQSLQDQVTTLAQDLASQSTLKEMPLSTAIEMIFQGLHCTSPDPPAKDVSS